MQKQFPLDKYQTKFLISEFTRRDTLINQLQAEKAAVAQALLQEECKEYKGHTGNLSFTDTPSPTLSWEEPEAPKAPEPLPTKETATAKTKKNNRIAIVEKDNGDNGL